MIRCEEVQTYVSNAGVRWPFIVELAPWIGGFYERLVSLFKKALRKTINRKSLTVIQLLTVLKEVEAAINSRLLVYVSDDIESTITLTSSHILPLNPTTGIPDIEDIHNDADYTPFERAAECLLQIWKKGQEL